MPTVLHKNGYAFRIYPNDHEPAHVHAVKGGGVTVINLGDEQTAPSIRESYGHKNPERAGAEEIVVEHQTELLEAWRELHG